MTLRPYYRFAPYLACLLACLIVDLIYFPPTTVFPDESRFLASAARIAASGEFWVDNNRAWEMPGTALFFAPAVKLFGEHGAVVPLRLAQAVLLLIQLGLIASIARRLFGKPVVGFIAACMAAIYPFFLYYQGLLLSETVFDTWFLAGIAALFWWRERGMQFDTPLVITSFCFVAATMVKASLTILPPLLIAATAWLAGASWRRLVATLIAASCLYAAFMSPWWMRNAALFHTFVPFATNGVQNLYLGNNPHNRDGGIDWKTDADPAVVAKISALPDELERQRAYAKAALDYIEQNPAVFLRAAVKKFVRFWNIVPNASEFRGGLYSLISAASFGPVLVLALICAGRRWRDWRLLAPLYLVIGYFTIVYVVTIASIRYRLPLEPLLIVLAAEPLAAVWQRLRPAPTPQRPISRS
jgi:hypothetical protein